MWRCPAALCIFFRKRLFAAERAVVTAEVVLFSERTALCSGVQAGEVEPLDSEQGTKQ